MCSVVLQIEPTKPSKAKANQTQPNQREAEAIWNNPEQTKPEAGEKKERETQITPSYLSANYPRGHKSESTIK